MTDTLSETQMTESLDEQQSLAKHLRHKCEERP